MAANPMYHPQTQARWLFYLVVVLTSKKELLGARPEESKMKRLRFLFRELLRRAMTPTASIEEVKEVVYVGLEAQLDIFRWFCVNTTDVKLGVEILKLLQDQLLDPQSGT
jgi:hypothetical protein